MLFFNINTNEKINNLATKFCNKTLRGRIFVTLRNHYVDINDTDNIYNDLDKETFHKMIKILNKKIKTDNMKLDHTTYEDDLKTNFHKLLNEKL
jgi:non-homologous end joining protein Ku